MDQGKQLKLSLGRVIRERRSGLGYSQESFADAAGVHKNYMGSVERGERNVSLRNLTAIAKALGLPLTMLIALAEGDMVTPGSEKGADLPPLKRSECRSAKNPSISGGRNPL